MPEKLINRRENTKKTIPQMNAKNANKSTSLFFNICIDGRERTNLVGKWRRMNDHLRSFAD